MKRQARERGDTNIGCILWALLLVAAAVFLWRTVPVKYANASLYDHMEELAKFSHDRNVDQLKKGILDKARELDLPVSPKQVWVEKTGDRIKMRCTYTVPVDLIVFTWEWKVDHVVSAPIFYT